MHKLVHAIPFLRNLIQLILCLLAFFGLLGLIVTIPIAMFSPARFARPWMIVSKLTIFTFCCAVGLLLLGWGC